MRMYFIVMVVLILTVIIPDLFFAIKIKRYKLNRWLHVANIAPGLFFIGSFLYLFVQGKDIHQPKTFYTLMWINFFFVLVYIPKTIYVIFHFVNFILNIFIPRRTFLFRWLGLVAATTVIVLLIDGAFINSTDYELRKVTIYSDKLPKAFDGYKVVQISDIHLGGWDSKYAMIEPVIEIINNEKADILIFSGDMVNNFKDEMIGWPPYFEKMKAKDGKYAVLGNHDYGDYVLWDDPQEKSHNLDTIKQNFVAMGFRLLLNEHEYLRRGTDSILIAGVENWGKPPFPKYGNLNEAMEGINDSVPTLLISHDPSHWRAEIVGRKQIILTMSGHTHAWQLAFKFLGKLYSPASQVYPEWDGLYSENGQFLYINRGLGFVGVPFRIGDSNPEITVITLKAGNSK